MCTGPKSIALLPLWFLKLSRKPKPFHSLLLVFIFFIIVISYFFVGRGEGLVYILRLFNPRLDEFV